MSRAPKRQVFAIRSRTLVIITTTRAETVRRLRDAVVFALVGAALALSLAVADASPTPVRAVDDASTLPACAVEDGSTGPVPCRWDGTTRGNGVGESYVVTAR